MNTTPRCREEMWRLKTRASGHGFGSGNNCAEFCYNTHKVQRQRPRAVVVGNHAGVRETTPLFPQGGTWIYDRAGWCPGAPVDTRDMELTPLVSSEEAVHRGLRH